MAQIVKNEAFYVMRALALGEYLGRETCTVVGQLIRQKMSKEPCEWSGLFSPKHLQNVVQQED